MQIGFEDWVSGFKGLGFAEMELGIKILAAGPGLGFVLFCLRGSPCVIICNVRCFQCQLTLCLRMLLVSFS